MKKILFFIIIMITFNSFSQEVENLIGLEINSKVFQDYLNKLETEPNIYKFPDNFYYIFKSKGIDFSINNSDIIIAVFLFSESSDGHRQFQGKIPYNIEFTDNRKMVETKLGPPDVNGGGGVLEYYSIWKNNKIKISVTYKSKDQEDMNNKIKLITISLKK